MGHLTHARAQGPAHRFRYPVYLHLLDLDELPALDARLRLFGHERPRPVTFRSRDHLGDASRPIRDNLRALFETSGQPFPDGRVLLLTHCRVFGYVFNPVSFFWCYDAGGGLAAVVAEVNNTFGERHPYLLPVLEGSTVWRRKKRMHVSPFFSMAGSYRFELPAPDRRAELSIDLCHGEGTVLAAHLSLERRALSDGALLRLLLSYPLLPLRVIGAIHAQALRLWWKGARVHRKPPSEDAASAAEGESA